MELEEFADLVANGNFYNIKNILQNLISSSYSEKRSKAIAYLYKSFPENLKSSADSKKTLAPLFASYFSVYELTKDNIDIYYEFESFFPSKHKDYIKVKNTSWIWDKEPEIIFKNALDFVKSIPDTELNSKQSPFDFIKKYKNQFETLMNKNRSKILEHFNKKNIWFRLIYTDYSKFTDFCKKYDIDKIMILKNQLVKIQTFSKNSFAYMGGFKDEFVDIFLKDLQEIGKEVFLNYPKMKEFKSFYPIEGENIMISLFHIISKKQYEAAVKYMVFFDTELDDIAKKISFNKSFSNSVGFKDLLDIYIENCDKSKIFHASMEAKKVKKNEEWFNYLNSYSLMKKLNTSLNNNELKSKKVKV